MRKRRLSPSSRLLRLMALLLLAALAVALLPLLEAAQAVAPLLGQAVLGASAVLVVVALWDLSQTWQVRGLVIGRRVPNSLPVNVWTPVELEISHPLDRDMAVNIYDHHPPESEIKHMPRRLLLPAGRVATLTYKLRPSRRGLARFGCTEISSLSPLKLWSCSRMWGEESSVRVYPDFAAVTHYQLLATDNHASQLGIRRRPRRGEGLEFHQLRDYRAGDSLRQIDWKATVRRDKLISKEYQDERDQQVFFMLDCGRRMRTRDGRLSHFDHSLNALLLLSYIALRQGDGVGLMSFAGDRRWLLPRKSAAAVNGILNTVYDLHPTTQASDYYSAAQEVLARQRKRSLVVLMTNLRQEDSEELLPVLDLLRRRHVVLVANLREKILDTTLETPVEGFDDALRYLGTVAHLGERQQAQQRLQGRGALCLDVVPDELAVRVVNSYLAIKRAGYL